MRFSSRIVIFIVYLSLAVSYCDPVYAGTGEQLPPDIARFYADYNFVAAFTTFEEEVALRGGRVVDALPPDMDSRRMKKVQKRLNRLNARILRSDPAIVVPSIKTAGTIPRGFLRITASRCSPNEMVLRVMIQEIAPPDPHQAHRGLRGGRAKRPLRRRDREPPCQRAGPVPRSGRTPQMDAHA